MANILVKQFDDYKKQGMTNKEAMKKAKADQAAATVKVRKIDTIITTAENKKKNWVIRLKEAVSLSFRAKQKDTANKKRYLEYSKKVGSKKHMFTYAQWLKRQEKEK